MRQCVPQPRTSPSLMKGWLATKEQDGVVGASRRDAAMRPATPNFPFITGSGTASRYPQLPLHHGKWQCVPQPPTSPSLMKGWLATKEQDGVVGTSRRDTAMCHAAPNFPFIDEGVACDEGARRGSRRIPTGCGNVLPGFQPCCRMEQRHVQKHCHGFSFTTILLILPGTGIITRLCLKSF